MVQSNGSMRQAAIDLFSRGAARMGVGWGCSLSGVSLVIPYYHMVSDEHVPHVSPLYRFRKIEEFTADVEYLARHFQPVTLGDIVDHLNGSRTLGPRCVHLTFDDGFREMYDIAAPILQRAGVPATFFVNTAFLDGGGIAHYNALSVLLDRMESRDFPAGAVRLKRLETLLPMTTGSGDTSLRQRMLALRQAQSPVVNELAEALDVDLGRYVNERRPYLSSEQVRSLLQSGFTVGAHSHDHWRYSELPLEGQIEQTRTSMQFLEQRFGVRPKSFAFPYSDTGVGSAFFAAVYAEPLLNVSFGTAGLGVRHFHPRNIERMSMEKTSAPAAQILAHQFARTAYFRLRARSNGLGSIPC